MKTALVTGAGSGIGRAVAVALGNSGYALALVGRRRECLEATAEMTGAPETLVLPADLSRAVDAEEAVRGATEGLGSLDVLVNNAGRGSVVPIASMTAAVWDQMLAVNASSAAYCTIAGWPWLVRAGGVVVNIASMAVYDPFEGFMAYGAAKAAMAHLTVSCAKEGAPAGVTAYCLCPGAVETPLLRSAFDESVIPASATLRPEEVAAVALACVRGERRSDNGRAIPVLPGAMGAWWEGWRASNPSGWLRMEAENRA
ncbi:MAG TPA: SDR family oxidoreductase [Phycisphaerales bacterium]|nr:SDR family oxidoreductase [Phycisphaerales bacterium]